MHSRLEYCVIFVNCHKIDLVLGCSDNQNCETAYCDNNHMCNLPPTIASVTTITVQIVMLLTGDQEFDSPKTLSAFALGLVLFVMTLILNIIALRVVQRFRERYE